MKTITPSEAAGLLNTLEDRFEKNKQRHTGIKWENVNAKLLKMPEKLISLKAMEDTGGEPDVIGYDAAKGEYIFCDCSAETPEGRRNVCYDREALDARKEHKPWHNAIDLAQEIGVDILDENQYRELQKIGKFDAKTSSWIATPADVRKLGGAMFADFRYGRVFVYHNGAQSYYGVRGFRGILKV
ncbi:MAG: DUF4256 domain-containing protein [Paludibacter sp.]|nr:DUF4256 domain-containing protein [Paludibacter sp.]